MKYFLGAVGVVTLVLGGLGVMNVMLVEVCERTREIGLRLAVGARRRQVLGQFLAEAMVITFVGGVIGIVVSYVVGWYVGWLPMLSALFEDESGGGDLRLEISLVTVAMSTLALTLVGLASGMLPAVRAARLDPATALRWE
jgi:ABC-type antimicrobial peptide transport system permease subunit